MYRLIIDKVVQKQLKGIPEQDYLRIQEAIAALALNPRPPGCKKLKGKPGYRIRQGKYRIIYEIEDQVLIVYVLMAGHRKDVYDE